MRLHNVTYLLKEGGRNIFSNKLMSFACIGVLVACFLLIGSAFLLSLTVSNVVEYVENQNEIVAFLDDGVTTRQAEEIGNQLRELENVSRITFVSKSDGLEKEKVKVEDDFRGLYDGLEDDNPLPDKYDIQIKQPLILDETIEEINAIPGVSKVLAQTDVTSALAGLKKAVNYSGACVIIILVAVSVVIITNTIKLTVYSRRKEINIMKYVGATDSFIRMPFLVEGMLIGMIAATAAFLLLGVGYTYLLRWAAEQHGDFLGIVLTSTVDFRTVALQIFLGFAAIGVFIGTVGSGVFVRKYLKV